MKIHPYFCHIVMAISLLLMQPLAAQRQGGSILPPPLKRPSTNTTATTKTPPASEDTPAQAASPRVTAFDDWVHRCSELTIEGESLTQCELLQVHQQQQGEEMLNILILALAAIKPEEGAKAPQFMLTSVVPLDVFLPDGMRFLVDSRALMQIPFRNCNMNGCWSQIIVEEDILTALKRGNMGLARFTVINGQEIEVKFSLKGLTAGLDALQQPL